MTSICERTQCGAQRKHVNIIRSHGHECHFAEVQSGDIRRRRQLEIRPIRAVLPACDARLLDHGEYRPRCINVRHADGHSPDAITPTEIVYCSYIQIIKKHDSLRHVQHQKWLVYRKRAHRRNAYTRAANACHFIIQPLAGATIGRDVMNTHARTHTNATNNTSSFFLFTAATQSNTRQSFAIKSVGRKQASKCVHRSVTATKHQECSIVRKRSTEGSAAYAR